MSIWTHINEFLSRISIEAFSGVVEAVRTVFEGQPEMRRQVSFSIAMIALSAKMAKADGVVTLEETEAFQQLFHISPREVQNVSRLYNLAKRDIAGYHVYARQVKKLFPANKPVYQDIMDGLFHIAKADGVIHERELLFLNDVAGIFDLSDREYRQVKARHMEMEENNPYFLLDADPMWSFDRLKKHYLKLVKENHPDRLVARGTPEEFIAIANNRLSSFNHAWEIIKSEYSQKNASHD